MKSSTSVEIDRPIAEVFEYTTNNVAEWSRTVVSDEVIEEKNGGGVGTIFKVVTEENGRPMEFHGIVTEYDPPTRSVVHLKGSMFEIDAAYDFESLDYQRTRVTQHSTVTGKGFLKIVFSLFGWLMVKAGAKAQEAELVNLKRMLEAGEA